MGFFKKVAGFLRSSKDESHDAHTDDHDQVDIDRVIQEQANLPRTGFSVPVQVPVERPQVGPVLIHCAHGDGGIQGLKWYAKRLRIDKDGDVGDEFLDEVMQRTPSHSIENQSVPIKRFEIKYSARPAKVKKQVMSFDGKIQQCVEFQGRLQWV